MIDEKILLVGPSSDIKNFNKDYFLKAREDKFLIVSYSDSLRHFLNIKFCPDFWSFIDPFTITRYLKEIKEHKVKNISLLATDMYGNGFEKFYQYGLTCSKLKRQPNLYEEIKSLNFIEFFKKSFFLDHKIIKYKDKINETLNFKDHTFLLRPSDHAQNFCKFSHYLIPMVLYFFKNTKRLRILGFGQYDAGRFIDNQNKKGYKEYVKSFNVVTSLLKYNLKDLNVEFEGDKSYFSQLITNE